MPGKEDMKVSEKNTKKKKNKKGKGKKILKYILLTFLWGIVIIFGLGVGVVYSIFQGAGELPLEQFDIDRFTTIIYDKDGNEYARLGTSENRIYVTLSEMSPYLPKAFIAIEDERFESHFGIDIKRTLAATVNYVIHGNSDFGGSTITQQLVKKVTEDDGRNWQRKVREIVRAIQLEQKMSKDQIIEKYMNIIFLGENSYGVETAAYTYFNKKAADLSIAECAMIAGLAQAPSSVNPFSNYEAAKKRQLLVLEKMHELKFITDEQYEDAKTEELVLKRGSSSSGGSNDNSYFVEAVIDAAIKEFQELYDVDAKKAEQMVYLNGYKIYTTVDPNIQAIMEDVYKDEKYFKLSNGKYDPNIQSAMVIIDYVKGNVVGLVGGAGEKTTQRGLNRATQSKRPPGSTMKPLGVYGPALEKGAVTIATAFDDSITTFNIPGSEPWTPRNSTGYQGLIPVKEAIYRSSNIVAAKVFVEKVGTEYSREFLKKLGITTLTNKDVNGGSLALGGMSDGIIPLEHAAAYGTFANNGIYMEPKLYTKILDKEDNVVVEKISDVRQVMSKQNAYLLTTCLQAVVTSGTGGEAAIPNMTVAGKTGTTNSSNDRWFAGYTPYYVGSVWVGYDTPKNISMSGNPAAKIWQAVMKRVHEGLENKSFAKPSGLVSYEVCKDSGMIPTDLCRNDPRGSRVTTALFVEGTQPKEECTMHISVPVCPDSYKLMNSTCMRTVSPVNRVFLNKEYAEVPNPLPKDYAYIKPKDYCTVHGGGIIPDDEWLDDYPSSYDPNDENENDKQDNETGNGNETENDNKSETGNDNINDSKNDVNENKNNNEGSTTNKTPTDTDKKDNESDDKKNDNRYNIDGEPDWLNSY